MKKSLRIITVIMLLVITIFLYSCSNSNDNDNNDAVIENTIGIGSGSLAEESSEENKKLCILVFCKDSRVKEALDAGATYAGTEYIGKVKGGWLDFDVAVATPDMMKDVGRLGMVLGRKGLMPNPKTGTVTNDLVHAISELKKGRTEFRADKEGVIHIAVGKVSMDADKVAENVTTLLSELDRKKPADAKADFVRSVSVSSSMGPGVWVDVKEEA